MQNSELGTENWGNSAPLCVAPKIFLHTIHVRPNQRGAVPPNGDEQMIIEKLAYTMPEAVQVSGRSRTSIYGSIKAEKLIARKDGSRTVILASDLRSWLENLPRLNTRTAA